MKTGQRDLLPRPEGEPRPIVQWDPPDDDARRYKCLRPAVIRSTFVKAAIEFDFRPQKPRRTNLPNSVLDGIVPGNCVSKPNRVGYGKRSTAG